jgi:competence ComEA-like helix-hairpin-helix protein
MCKAINEIAFGCFMVQPTLRFMRTRSIPLAVSCLALILCFPGCVKRSRSTGPADGSAGNNVPIFQRQANEKQPETSSSSTSRQITAPLINLNTASEKELETLPGIGKGLAERIIEHREKFGSFRRPEYLISVRGISDKRFRALRDLVTVQ